MSFRDDERVVLTLDAGGTNFVFAALRGGHRIGDAVTLPSEANDLDASLSNLASGFEAVTPPDVKPAAISFAFPGPADYEEGVIENVGNLPAYSGRVPLGDILEKRFGVPVYINNDGDLFAYGEASGGLLPDVNASLAAAGVTRRYRNLIGVTLGTGFGGGIVIDGRLLRGDNSAAGEVWLLRHPYTDACVEQGVSSRAVVETYRMITGATEEGDTPERVARIARGEQVGSVEASREAFARFGAVLGDALANLITVIDGLVVIGGGMTGAYDLFAPSMFSAMNGKFDSGQSEKCRLVQRVVDLEVLAGANDFVSDMPRKQTGVGLSRLGASSAVMQGAYAFAIEELSRSD